MSRYLRHFTAVGDDKKSVNKWHAEELHEVRRAQEQAAGDPTASVTFRESCRRLFSSEWFQITVVCLVILDATFVLIELLMDLSIIKSDHEKVAPQVRRLSTHFCLLDDFCTIFWPIFCTIFWATQVFHYLSLALLTFFIMELVGKIYAYRCEFFHHKFEVFDGVVVIVSFVLDIVYIAQEDAFDGVGFLILLRLWRVARIINGIIVSVQNRAYHRVEVLTESNNHLTQQVNDLQEHNSRLEQENDKLRTLLRNNGIAF